MREKAGEALDVKSVVANLAERRWCAFAWPEKFGETGRRAFFVSEDGEVWTTDGAETFTSTPDAYPEKSPPRDGRGWRRTP